ncbi:MAG: protein YgfX [Plesiomonas sp.]|uniref:protein YgfX n=1 Tax=Plesiomonas sp. TaxID=2486279 RepID=UPI003EE710F0
MDLWQSDIHPSQRALWILRAAYFLLSIAALTVVLTFSYTLLYSLSLVFFGFLMLFEYKKMCRNGLKMCGKLAFSEMYLMRWQDTEWRYCRTLSLSVFGLLIYLRDPQNKTCRKRVLWLLPDMMSERSWRTLSAVVRQTDRINDKYS